MFFQPLDVRLCKRVDGGEVHMRIVDRLNLVVHGLCLAQSAVGLTVKRLILFRQRAQARKLRPDGVDIVELPEIEIRACRRWEGDVQNMRSRPVPSA